MTAERFARQTLKRNRHRDATLSWNGMTSRRVWAFDVADHAVNANEAAQGGLVFTRHRKMPTVWRIS